MKKISLEKYVLLLLPPSKSLKKILPKYIQPPKKATFCRHTEAKSLQLYTAVHYFSRWLKKFIVYKQKKNQIQSFPAHVVFTISYYPIAIKYLLHYKKKRFRKKNLPFFYPKTKYFPHPLQKNKQCRWKNAFFSVAILSIVRAQYYILYY